MPKTPVQKKIFNDKILEAKELFNKVKSNIKNKQTRFKYGFDITNSNNLHTINKVIRELSLFNKYDQPIILKNLGQLKKHDLETERNLKYDPIIKSLQLKTKTNINLYKNVLDIVGISPDVKVFNTKLRIGKNDIMEIMINKPMDREQIESLGTKISKVFKSINGKISTTIRSDKWYYAGENSLGANVSLYDLYDHEVEGTYQATTYFIRVFPNSQGGNQTKNNCLYDCLVEFLGNRLIWKSSDDFRRFLKVQPNEKIDIKYMKQIELKLNVNINVCGDYTYTSHLAPQLMKMNLILINEHYSINRKKYEEIKVHNQISNQERKPLIYDSKKFQAFDGKKLINLTTNSYADILYWRTDYILIPSEKANEEEYKKFIEKADRLKAETNGEINFYKTGSDKITALNLFNNYTQHIKIPQKIEQVEGTFILKASQGALIFNTKGYEGLAYKADVKSMYPSILKSRILFPIKAGELRYITNFDERFYFGIYRCKITGSSKLFRFNFDNYYTHFDLTTAKEIGLNIELIIDDQPNFLYYSRDSCLTGYEIFGRYVDKLFDLKQRKIPGSKAILNILWGALCEKNKKDFKHKIGKSDDMPTNIELNFIKPDLFDKDANFISYTKLDDIYKHSYARIMPFLLSKARRHMNEILRLYEDKVIRLHTDGCLFSQEPKNIKYGDKLGDLVFEGYYDHITINKSGEVRDKNGNKLKN